MHRRAVKMIEIVAMVTFDDAFEIDFRPAVPATVRAELNKVLRGSKRIVVYEQIAEGKTSKINGFRLTGQAGALPREGLDEIAEGVTAIMHRAWYDQETEDPDIGLPPMEFVVVLEYDGKGRKRSQFRYTYKGADEPDFAEETLSTAEQVTQRALELLERVNALAFSTIHDYQERFIEIVQQNTAQSAAGAQLMQHAIPMWLSANQQVLNARTLEFSAAKADAQEKATTARMAAAMKFLGPYVGLGLQQFVAAKFGVQLPMQMPDLGDDDPTDPPTGGPSGAGASGRGAPTNGVPANGAHPEEAVPEHIMAAMANHFGDGLTSSQRAELNKLLTKKQQAYFDALFCAKTDADAFSAYQQVAANAMDKLGLLQSLLTKEQTEILGAFMQAAAQHHQAHHPPE